MANTKLPFSYIFIPPFYDIFRPPLTTSIFSKRFVAYKHIIRGEIIMISNKSSDQSHLQLVYKSAPTSPYERKLLFVNQISISQNKELIFKLQNEEGDNESVVIKLLNQYDSKMLFVSLFNQIGTVKEKGETNIGVIDLSKLVGSWCLFTFQSFNYGNGNAYQNVKDILIVDDEKKSMLLNGENILATKEGEKSND